MRKLFAVIALLLLPANAYPLEVAGVAVAPQVNVNGQTLRLNGYGVRSKFFVKVYVGSLYTARRLATPAQLLDDPGDKLIRMQFVHSRVDKEKIVAAFAEGLANNAPQAARSAEARQFLAFFAADFLQGETVDLLLGADGTVTVRHDGKLLGSLRSAPLARGVLAIYFGDRPADKELKAGMLGTR